MTALAQERLTTSTAILPSRGSFPIEANTRIWKGSLVALNAAGNLVPAGTAGAVSVVGKASATYNNLTGSSDFSGLAGATNVEVEFGKFGWTNSPAGVDFITNANVGQPCFAADDNTVALTNGGSNRLPAGIIGEVGLDGFVYVWQTPEIVAFSAGSSLYSGLEEPEYRVRTVVTANVASLAAFVGVTGGSSTNTDGVLCVQGDLVLLTAQTTASQNGLYVVGAVAAGSAPLTRPSWYGTGSTQLAGYLVQVSGEGTVFKNTSWKAFVAAPTFVVDTTDPKFYPLSVTWSSALVAGTLTAGAGATAGAPAVMPVFSANSQLVITRKTPNTTAATVMYALNAAPTPGVPGVGAIGAFATVAAGTINNADISTLTCTLINQI